MLRGQLSNILQMINQARFVQAWHTVAATMRAIEAFDSESIMPDHNGHVLTYAVQYQSASKPLQDFSKETTDICLQLIDLECFLSFFTGGASILSSWSQGRFLSSKIEQHRSDDPIFATKILLFDDIQKILQIDVSDEQGLRKFLRSVNELISASPASELVTMTKTVIETDSEKKHELKIVADLAFILVHCRKATICTHYLKGARPEGIVVPPVLQGLGIDSAKQKDKEFSQIRNHASSILETFDHLCKVDPKGITTQPFILYGAAIAALLLAIYVLENKTIIASSFDRQLRGVKIHLESMQLRNAINPFIQPVISILQECLPIQPKSTVFSRPRTEHMQSRKPYRDDLTIGASFTEDDSTWARSESWGQTSLAETSQVDRSARDGEQASYVKRPSVATVGPRSQAVAPPVTRNDDVDGGRNVPDNPAYSFTSSYENVPSQYPETDIDINQSFTSTTSTLVAQSPLDDYPSSLPNFYHPVSSERIHPPLNTCGGPPEIPLGNNWSWCADTCWSTHQMNDTLPDNNSLFPQQEVFAQHLGETSESSQLALLPPNMSNWQDDSMRPEGMVLYDNEPTWVDSHPDYVHQMPAAQIGNIPGPMS